MGSRARAPKTEPARTAERRPPAAFEIEPHAERRRRQMIEIASHLIEQEGPDAVRMSRVAELAGCTRPLTYRYFPQREDLLAAVLAHYYEHLNRLLTADEHARGIAALADPDAEAAWQGSRPLLEGVWDVVDELGIGGLVLSRSEIVRSPHFVERATAHAAETERRWFAPLRAAGLDDLACALTFDCATSATYSLSIRYRAGEISREQAIRLGFTVLHSLISGLRAERSSRA